MGMEQTQRFCNRCGRHRLFTRPGTNHILHLLLSLVTVGLWLPIWLLCAIRVGGWRCTVCGSHPRAQFLPALVVLLLLIVGGIAFLGAPRSGDAPTQPANPRPQAVSSKKTAPNTQPSVGSAVSVTPAPKTAVDTAKRSVGTKAVRVEAPETGPPPETNPLRTQLESIRNADISGMVKELSAVARVSGGSLQEKVTKARGMVEAFCASLEDRWGKPAAGKLASGLRPMVSGANGLIVCKIDEASLAKLLNSEVIPLQAALVADMERRDRLARQAAEGLAELTEKRRVEAAREKEAQAAEAEKERLFRGREKEGSSD